MIFETFIFFIFINSASTIGTLSCYVCVKSTFKTCGIKNITTFCTSCYTITWMTGTTVNYVFGCEKTKACTDIKNCENKDGTECKVCVKLIILLYTIFLIEFYQIFTHSSKIWLSIWYTKLTVEIIFSLWSIKFIYKIIIFQRNK